MKRVIIKNIDVITMKNEKDILRNIDILIEKDKIIKIDKNIEVEDCIIVDGNNKVALPGFINAHMHIPMSLFRNTIDDELSLQEWLETYVWKIEPRLTGENMFDLAMLSSLEMIENGITLGVDHHFMAEHTIEALNRVGVDYIATRCLMDIDNKGKERFDEFKRLLDRYGNNKIKVGIHGLYTCSEPYIKEITDFARLNNYTVQMHFCENEEEVAIIKRIYNVEHPSMVLEKYFKGINLILAHCVVIDEYDLKVLKDLNATIVHCPVSNLMLECGIANINTYVKEGLNVCLGTDGQGSGNNLSMLDTMKIALLLQKGINKKTLLSPYKMLEMSTVNAACAYNIDNLLGTIEEGKIANITILSLNSSQLFPINNLISDIVYNSSNNNISTVIINGKIVMENYKIKNINKQETIDKSSKIANKLLEEQ